MNSRDLATILHDCLQLMREEGLDIEACLARYPGQAEALRPLLSAAARLSAVPASPAPPPAYQAGLSQVLHAVREARLGPPAQIGFSSLSGSGFARWWAQSALVARAVALALALILLSGSGLALAGAFGGWSPLSSGFTIPFSPSSLGNPSPTPETSPSAAEIDITGTTSTACVGNAFVVVSNGTSRTVVLAANAEIEGPNDQKSACSDLVANLSVKVEGSLQANGTVLAREVRVLPTQTPQATTTVLTQATTAEIKGTVQSLNCPYRLDILSGTTTYAVNLDVASKIEGPADKPLLCTDLAGRTVEVKGIFQSTNTILAREVGVGELGTDDDNTDHDSEMRNGGGDDRDDDPDDEAEERDDDRERSGSLSSPAPTPTRTPTPVASPTTTRTPTVTGTPSRTKTPEPDD